MDDTCRLIEHWMPIASISQESQREKHLRKGHLSTLHQWWSRKPLVASRAAVFGALAASIPALQPTEDEADSFVSRLCRWELEAETLDQARRYIKEARGHTPKVLDPFSGGGSIPLEALRLGCDVVANDLNPVSHLLLQCTLEYPHQWQEELIEAVERWGDWVQQRVAEDIGDLYQAPEGTAETTYIPSAYLWTRVAPCHNPTCQAQVPLLRKSWLSRRSKRYIALSLKPDLETGLVRFGLVHSKAATEKEAIKAWGFDPGAFSKGGHVGCLHCGSALTPKYVREQGVLGALGVQFMALACTRQGKRGKVYFTGDEIAPLLPDTALVEERIEALCKETGLTPPEEPLPPSGSLGVSVRNYGCETWSDLFLRRQLCAMLGLCKWVQKAYEEVQQERQQSHPDDAHREDFARAVVSYLALGVTKCANRGSALVIYNPHGEKLESPISNGRMAFNWDIAETNPLGEASGNFRESLRYTTQALRSLMFETDGQAQVTQGPAQWLDLPDGCIDAVITDPPYYDNVPYSNLADYFYIWLKRMLVGWQPGTFALPLTPKKRELVVDRSHFDGDHIEARDHFEQGMTTALEEMHRVLKDDGVMVLIYAHKTTFGWSSLIDALRKAGFEVTEAWPMATERAARLRAQRAAALASSIFLVARKRSSTQTADLVSEVLPELRHIVAARASALFALGLQGADLVIACVGAGMRAFTRHPRVERPDGSLMDTVSFLQEVQKEVAAQVLSQIMDAQDQAITSIDPMSQFYVMARFQFGEEPIPFDEANILARGLGLALEKTQVLMAGKRALVKKSGAYVTLRDYQERGERMTWPEEEKEAPALLDLLHRVLWLIDHEPPRIPALLSRFEAQREPLRLLAQALGGKTFDTTVGARRGQSAKRRVEQKQIDILLASWSAFVG